MPSLTAWVALAVAYVSQVIVRAGVVWSRVGTLAVALRALPWLPCITRACFARSFKLTLVALCAHPHYPDCLSTVIRQPSHSKGGGGGEERRGPLRSPFVLLPSLGSPLAVAFVNKFLCGHPLCLQSPLRLFRRRRHIPQPRPQPIPPTRRR